MSAHNRPFYGQWVLRQRQQEYIASVLAKYQREPATDALKKKVFDELQTEKHLGRVIIPFRVVLRKDVYGKYPDRIEVILDTKV